MNKLLDSDNSGVAMMVIATSLCNKYDEWSTNLNIMNSVDIKTNTICIGLKELYPTIDDKVVQSIALAYTMYFVILIQDNLHKTKTKILYDEQHENSQYENNSQYVPYCDLSPD